MIKSGQYLLVVGYVKPNTSLLSAVLSYATDWVKNLAVGISTLAWNAWFVQTCEFALPPPLSLMAYHFAYEREMYQILQKMFKSHISATWKSITFHYIWKSKDLNITSVRRSHLSPALSDWPLCSRFGCNESSFCHPDILLSQYGIFSLQKILWEQVSPNSIWCHPFH